MRKVCNRIICILLALIMCVPALTAAVFAAGNTRSDIPVVYVEGQGSWLYINPNTEESRNIYPMNIETDYIKEKAKQYLPVFAKAVLTQQWGEFCDGLYESFVPLYDDVRLDKNGEVSNGSGCYWDWSRDSLTDMAQNGTYGMFDYEFHYDWRLSPMVVAQTLHRYIEDVKYVTGHDKVSVVGRCLGAAIVSAYMTMYEGESIDTCILYCGSHNGATSCSKPFCCEIYLMDEAVDRYVNDISLVADRYVNEFIQASVTLLDENCTLALLTAAVNNVYPSICLDINPRIIRESYGSYPSYWSMVCPEDYEKAKECVFYGADIDEYAGLIEKIDDYYYNVQLKFDETFKRLQQKGIKFGVIAKYGYQAVPVGTDHAELSDSTVTLHHSSMGATTSKVMGTLGDEYIRQAKEKGTAKYISPDRQVDASTCILPDNTWIIKNLLHKVFPSSVDELMMAIMNFDGQMTVTDNEQYPQYLVYNDEDGSIVPMTEDNCNTTERWNVGYFQSKINFIRALFNLLKNYIKTKFSF